MAALVVVVLALEEDHEAAVQDFKLTIIYSLTCTFTYKRCHPYQEGWHLLKCYGIF
ncbi:hypothetical protein GCM10008968_13790 [Bacillus horti]